MAHSYRTLQLWNQWLTDQFLGREILEAETKTLATLLSRHFGKQSLLIGVPNQYELLHSTSIPCHSLITPLFHTDHNTGMIESNLNELPILTGSIDLVILPHTLELIDQPRILLSEACRVIKPEGLIAIIGFNPYSLWGLWKLMFKSKVLPLNQGFIEAYQVKNWLRLQDFAMEKQSATCFRPPLDGMSLYNKLYFLETLGSKCCKALGGIYTLIARAKVVPLTPIKLKWKQQLSGIQITPTITGHIARYEES